MIDALSYQYDQAPRLSKVTDSAPAPANIEGFRPGGDGRASYLYDYNGNMTFDPHKNLTITYNFLNLPKTINGITVVYDATGRKLRLGSGATARETFNGIDFVGGKLEGMLHDKGRLAPELDEFGVNISRLRSEYWRQDHLGNTRVAFSDQNENGIKYTARPPQVIFDLLFSHPAALQSLADAPASSAFCALQAEKIAVSNFHLL